MHAHGTCGDYMLSVIETVRCLLFNVVDLLRSLLCITLALPPNNP